MQLNMRNGNVALKLLNPNNTTPGGIFIPETIKQGTLRLAKVLAAGPGEPVQGIMKECELKAGDEVVFDSSRSEPISVDGEEVFVCNMIDVLATISAKHLSVVKK